MSFAGVMLRGPPADDYVGYLEVPAGTTCPLVTLNSACPLAVTAARSVLRGISVHLQLAALMLAVDLLVQPGNKPGLGMAGVH